MVKKAEEWETSCLQMDERCGEAKKNLVEKAEEVSELAARLQSSAIIRVGLSTDLRGVLERLSMLREVKHENTSFSEVI